MDGGAWWAAVYGVAQSWTLVKRLSSSSSSSNIVTGHYGEISKSPKLTFGHHSSKISKTEWSTYLDWYFENYKLI